MEWLNYHHLLYFWMVGRTGTIAKASKELDLAQPTISGQIRALEERIGEKLFNKVGRNLVLTETGEVVFEYAEEIFSTGQELMDTLRGRPAGRPSRLQVGVSDSLPKTLVHHLLEPALHHEMRPMLICQEDKTDRLLAELSIRRFDLVLADEPVSGPVRVKAFNHLLGECGLSFFASPALVDRCDDFPGCLAEVPVLLPTENTVSRRAMDQWFERHHVRPNVVAEFEDSALMKQFGRKGAGLFAGPTPLEDDICRDHHVKVVGRTGDVRVRFYAITVERRIKHPAVQALVDAARGTLFRA